MRGRTILTAEEAAVEFEGNNGFSWIEVFAREAAVEIDLGCGDGTLITALAAQHPERNYLGIENMAGRVRSVCRKAASRGLANVRVWKGEIEEIVRDAVPRSSVAAFYFFFPDPWPKRRHWQRRSFTASLLRSLETALVPDGLLHLATDHAGYFSRMNELLRESDLKEIEFNPGNFPTTTFAQKFHQQRIYRLSLVKPDSELRNTLAAA